MTDITERLRGPQWGGITTHNVMRDAAAEIERLRAALTWALGANGEFRQQGTMDGAYWWRGELAERAGLRWDGQQYVAQAALGE